MERSCAIFFLGLSTAILVLLAGSSTSADQVEFEMDSYWCERMVGAQVIGSNRCLAEVAPTERNCQELGHRLEPLTDNARTDARALIEGQSGGFCGRKTTKELIALAQEMRYRAMSYVSLGYDETVCDPAGRPESGCNEGSIAAYHLYMCAAYRCKYGN